MTDDPALTPNERRALTALRKWSHRDSPVAAECDRILGAGKCADADETLLSALRLYEAGVTTKTQAA